MKNQSVIYVVLDGYDHIVSKATNDYEVANKYCEALCEKACNPNSYYVYELDYVEYDKHSDPELLNKFIDRASEWLVKHDVMSESFVNTFKNTFKQVMLNDK